MNKVLTFPVQRIMQRFFSITLVVGTLITTVALAQESKKADPKTSNSTSSYKMYKDRSAKESGQDLLQQANRVRVKDQLGALRIVEEALGLSIAENDVYTEAKCYVLIGEINEGIGEWKLALQNFSKAYEKLKGQLSESAEYKRVLIGVGTANLKLANYTAAIAAFQEASNIESNSKVGDDNSEIILSISEVYYQMGEYQNALDVLTPIKPSSARKRAVSRNPQSLTARIQNQEAKIYARTNQVEKSQELFKKSLENTSDKTKNTSDTAQHVYDVSAQEAEKSIDETKEQISEALRGQNRLDDEIDLRQQSIQYNLSLSKLGEVAKDKIAIGNTLAAKGETNAALREVEEAVSLADSVNDPGKKADALLVLATLYEKNGSNAQALSAYKRYSGAVADYQKQSERELQNRSDLILQQQDIEKVTKDVSVGQQEVAVQEATVFRQQLTIYGLLVIIIIIAVTSYYIYKNAQASKVANQLLALKSLRGQMNPHFIFNALNSVNQFIAQQDERTANRFLSEFSQLMRLVLENSQQDFITLTREREILSLYLKLEHYRFRDKFDYEIEIDPNINSDVLEVPPMLIQPYIENAVWHGLRYRDTKGKLVLKMHQHNSSLIVDVIDDGIGRKRSEELKTLNQRKHNSTGLKNVQERLLIINKVYKKDLQVTVQDGEDGTGTHVRIVLPVNQSAAV
jgi:tetratricopeptide (TPR) repeat protein